MIVVLHTPKSDQLTVLFKRPFLNRVALLVDSQFEHGSLIERELRFCDSKHSIVANGQILNKLTWQDVKCLAAASAARVKKSKSGLCEVLGPVFVCKL